MNEQNTKAQEAYKAMLEAHDAEVRQGVIAEVRDRLIGFVSRLKEAAQTQLEAVNLMETTLMDKPAVPGKRKRAPTVARKPVMDAVCKYLSRIEDDIPVPTSAIAEKVGFGPLVTRKACEELDKRGWIKHEAGKGYRWIGEQEAERENGLRTGLDDGLEIE